MKAKHSSNSSILKKFIILFFIILLIFAIFFFINKNNKKGNNIFSSKKNNNTTSSSISTVDTIDIPDQIGSYTVVGKIVIDKIKIEQYILDTEDLASLELGTRKKYGPNLNEPGNFCISGHNYTEIFGLLPNLQIDDTFDVIDKEKSRKVTYKIYDKYTVYPEDLDCLNQDTNDKREVTLITCTPGNLTRLIIKAKEI